MTATEMVANKELKRPNFYILLELPIHPPEQELSRIRLAIDTKKKDWQKQINHPSKGEQYKYYRSLIGEIERIMLGDPNAREEEAESAKEEQERERRQKEKERLYKLRMMVEIVSAKGYVTEAEIASMKRFSNSEEEIRRQIQVEVKKEHETKKKNATTKPPEMLSQTKMNQITAALKNVSTYQEKSTIVTLYDYFNLPENCTETQMLEEQAPRYESYAKKPPGHKDIEYVKEICAHTKEIFKDTNMRKKYDESLKFLRFSQLKEYIDTVATVGAINHLVYKEIVIRIMNRGLSEREAQQKLEQYCLEKGYEVESSSRTKDEKQNFKQCGFCGFVNLYKATHCIDCGHGLAVVCKKCKVETPSSSKHCGSCGVSLQGLQLYEQYMKRGYEALVLKELEEADRCFFQAKILWDNEEVKKALAAVNVEKEKIQKLIDTIKMEIKNRMYYAAEKKWFELQKLQPNVPEHTFFEREIPQHLNMTRVLISRANQSTDKQEKERYYIEAIQNCSDCIEAKGKLAEIPPEKPSSINGFVKPSHIELRWMPPNNVSSIQYKVIRKEGSPPLHLSDGEVIADIRTCSYVDEEAEAGKKYYYAVYTFRGKVGSKAGMIAGPFMRTAEVEDLQCIVEEDFITLKWKCDVRRKVEVRRKEGKIPMNRTDGIKLSGIQGNEIIDRGVQKGKQYGYKIFVQYEDEQGNPLFSEGEGILVTSSHIKPITDLDYKVVGQQVDIRWNLPAEGEVYLYAFDKPFNKYRTGECCSFQSIGKELENYIVQNNNFEAQMGVGYAEVTLIGENPIYILPITKVNDIVVVGQLKMIKKFVEVSNIRHIENEKQELILQWKWPANVEKLLVVYSEEGYPTSLQDSKCIQRHCSKTMYDSFQGYKVGPIKQDQYFYITIYIMEETMAGELYSEGARYFYTNAEQIELLYKLEKKLFSRKKTLILSSTDNSVPMPGLVLVKKKGTLPLRVAEGEEVFRIQAGTDLKEGYHIDLTEHSEKDWYFKLFFENELDATQFRLEPLGELRSH